MNQDNHNSSKDQLRKRAEELLQKRGITDPNLYSRSLEQLIEELQIYQFELEHQNQELQRVSDELAVSLKNYADLYHNAPAIYITIDEENTITKCNQTFCRILQMDITEVEGEVFTKFLHTDSQDEFYLAMIRLEKSKEVTGITLRIGNDSEETGIFLRGNMIRSGKNRSTLNMLHATKEVSDERDMKFQSLLLDNISEYITATDVQGNITWVSDAVCRLFGKGRSELIGKSIREFGENPKKGASQKEILESTLENGEWNGEVVNLLSNGKEIIMNCRTRILKDANESPYGMVGISTDITELKEKEEYLRARNREYAALTEEYESQNKYLARLNKELQQTAEDLRASETINAKHLQELERQNTELKRISKELNLAKGRAEESDRLKSAFLGNMSHELRTPLNAIIGFSSLLEEDSSNVDVARFNEIIHRNGRDLLEIIENSLDLSLIESGQMRLILSDFATNELIEELIADAEQMRRHHKKDNLEIEHSGKVSGGIEAIVSSDRGKIKQIIKNLIANAIKYTESGFVSWDILLTQTQFICVVKDSGVGIAKDKLEIIFDRFRIADETTTRKYGGAGLGLAISVQMAALLGGDINVSSELGKGSTFKLSVPRKLEFAEPATISSVLEKSGINISYKWNSKLALVVDDDTDFLKILERILKGAGMQVLSSTNGEEAIRFLKQNLKTDIVLMDISMPGMNGIEATRRIRKISETIPVIAVTAHTEKLVLDDVINAGYTDYVIKPIQHKELLSKMASYIH